MRSTTADILDEYDYMGTEQTGTERDRLLAILRSRLAAGTPPTPHQATIQTELLDALRAWNACFDLDGILASDAALERERMARIRSAERDLLAAEPRPQPVTPEPVLRAMEDDPSPLPDCVASAWESHATSADGFRERIDALGFTQSSLAREMQRLGDPRPWKTILRNISNWARGATDVPGEMWVVLHLLEKTDAMAS